MITTQHSPLKKFCLWCLIIVCGIAAICLVFASFISLWIGIVHIDQDAFWVPVLAGAILLSAVLVFFIRAVKCILTHIKADAFNS